MIQIDNPPISTADTLRGVERPPSDDLTLAGDPPERLGSTISDIETRVRDQQPRTTPSVEHRFTRGDEVGRYVILERVGAGGMGVVYAAWDPKLDRKVALKLLHSDKQAHGQRLQREAQAMARLTHPNVITVHDVGDIGGKVFVAMEFVEGQTLGEWARLERSNTEAARKTDVPPRSWSELLEVMLAAGRGLAAAHAQGLVHRDFKPDNVMIGADGRVRVMDFGLVRAAGSLSGSETLDEGSISSASLSASSARVALEDLPHMNASLEGGSAFGSELTMVGALLGTPAYMAPEQLRGEEADPAADQFAYCVVLWQCLYGERPFGGDTPLAVLFAISHATFRDAAPGRVVPTWIRRALERGLAADPAARWPDMPSLLRALADDPKLRRRPYVLGGAVLASMAALVTTVVLLQPDPPPPPCEQAGAELHELWSDERKASLAATFTASKLVYADESWTRAATKLDDWSANWIAARRDACEATEVRHEQSAELLDLRMACLDQQLHRFAALVDVLADADDTVIEKAIEAVEALPTLEVCADRIWLTAAVRPPEDPQLATAVEQVRESIARAEALTDGGKPNEALAVAEQAELRARELDWPPLLAEAATTLGRVQQERGEFAKSRDALQAGYFAARRGGHDEITLRSAALLIYTLGVGLGELEPAAVWIQHALAESDRIGRGDLTAEVHASIGIHHYLRSELPAAAEAFARALELHADAKSTGLASAHINYGTVLINVDPKRREQAFAELDLGLAMLIEIVGPQHPTVAVALSNYATVHGALDENQQAIVLLERALEINERALGPSHPMTALVELNLATNLRRLGTPESVARGLALAERALATNRQVFGEQHPRVAETEREVARTLLALDRPRDAKAHFEVAQGIWRESFGLANPQTISTTISIARCDSRLGQPDEALAKLEALLAYDVEPGTRAGIQLELAQVLLERDPKRARMLLEAAIVHVDQDGTEEQRELATTLRKQLAF
jgi:serine/threonine protein kinase/tetratricopeptide (TPR) repeat protein